MTPRFCERRLRMRYVAMLALVAFLVVPLAGCKKEEPVPPVPPVTEPAETTEEAPPAEPAPAETPAE